MRPVLIEAAVRQLAAYLQTEIPRVTLDEARAI